jgi:hypothetical protein
MRSKSVLCSLCLAVAGALSVSAFSQSASAATVNWDAFIIRTVVGATTPVVPVESASGQGVTVNIDESGEKAGYGTTAFNGLNLGTLGSISYTRLDAGIPDPYLNIWITNGTDYALIAPVTNMATGGGYTSNDINGLSLKTLGFNIYETNFANLSWILPGAQRVAQGLMHADGTPILLSEIAGLTMADPGVYPNPPIGSGAPKNGSAVNLIFGDTMGNFVSPLPYQLEGVTATAVPIPMAALGALPLLGLAALKRRRA